MHTVLQNSDYLPQRNRVTSRVPMMASVHQMVEDGEDIHFFFLVDVTVNVMVNL